MDPLSFPRALAVEQGQGNAIGEQDPRGQIIDRDADAHRATPRMPGDGHEAAHALGDLIDAGTSFVRPVLTKARDAAVHDLRIDLPHGLVVHAEFVLHRGLVVLDHDVGLLHELEENLQPFLRLQVEREALLVAMQVLEIRAVAPPARGIDARPGSFDLDHVGAPIGKLTHGRRTGPMGGQVDHGEIGQGQAACGHGCDPLSENDGHG
jgi:hypothetical protein